MHDVTIHRVYCVMYHVISSIYFTFYVILSPIYIYVSPCHIRTCLAENAGRDDTAQQPFASHFHVLYQNHIVHNGASLICSACSWRGALAYIIIAAMSNAPCGTVPYSRGSDVVDAMAFDVTVIRDHEHKGDVLR